MRKRLSILFASYLFLWSVLLIYRGNAVLSQETKPTISLWYKDNLINDKAIKDPEACKISLTLHNYPKANAAMISDKPNFEGVNWEPVTYLAGSNVWQWEFTKNDGVKIIYVRFRNNDGTYDDINAQYTLDTTLPFGGIAINNKAIGPARLEVDIYLGAEDNLTGVTDIQISKKNDFSDTFWQPYVTAYKWWPFGNVSSFEAEKIVKEKNAQEEMVYVHYRDGAGNISETYKDSFIYDGSPPKIYVETSPSDTLEQTITILAYDEFSNLGKMFITNDPLFIENMVSMPYQQNVSWKFDERRVVWVKIQDSVGNEAEPYPAYLAPVVTFTPWPSWTPVPGQSSNINIPSKQPTPPLRPTLISEKSEKFLQFKKQVEELQKGHKQLTANQKNLQQQVVKQEKRVSFLEELINKITFFLKRIFGFSSKKKSDSLSITPATTSNYYGHSTLGNCTTDGDCLLSGCNGEICQSKKEEPLNSICVVPDKPLPKQLGYQCRCLVKKCQWVK